MQQNNTNVSQNLIDEFEKAVKCDVEDRVREVRAQKWQQFLDNKIKEWTTSIKGLKPVLPPAKNKTPYHTLVPLDIDDIFVKKAAIIIDCGLELTVADDYKSIAIDGIPLANDPTMAFEIPVIIDFYHHDFPDCFLPPLKLKLTVNPLSKDLWRDLPVPENIEYPKNDTDNAWINPTDKQQKTVIAASKRGRSHAHEGKPRDDHFSINVTEDGWYVLVVADGAGSAPFSREGSRIACETSNKTITDLLKKNQQVLTEIVNQYSIEPDSDKKTELRKKIGDLLYCCLITPAYVAHNEIKIKASDKKRLPKDYATTLLMAIAKKINEQWFIGSFSIGDGAIAIYNEKDNSVKLMCEPDEGEFSGQTRFITMNELFMSANQLYKRLRFHVTNDFSSLMLMTDGISDAFFETDKNLKDVHYWEKLQKDILLTINPTKNQNVSPETQSKRLLQWLDFWSPGNHDDRTIVILH